MQNTETHKTLGNFAHFQVYALEKARGSHSHNYYQCFHEMVIQMEGLRTRRLRKSRRKNEKINKSIHL